MLTKVLSHTKRRARKYVNLAERGAAFWWSKARGRSFVEHYAGRMDRLFSKDTSWGLAEDRRFQIDYLVAHGLKPNSTLLDLGCGPIAAGQHMIGYLDAGNYSGADISQSALVEARKRVDRFGLSGKSPAFAHMPSGSLSAFHGKTFDFIWANSVLTHLPPEAAFELLCQVQPLMNANSIFFATFMRGDAVGQHNYENFSYPPEEIERLARKAGLHPSIMDDWRHPNDPKGVDAMARFILA